jgi:glycosyltransferase involved in cell wall biosynthesis
MDAYTHRTPDRHEGVGREPLVSIGMPVFNSAATLRDAMDSVLQQTLGDIELIVSDNASTDGTWDIVEEVARRDPRVIGLRQPRNIGANGNYTAVFRPARAPYFKWASSNDWCAPEFLQRCVDRLQAQPDTVLVAPRTRLFQDTRDASTDYDHDFAFEQDNPVDRFIAVGSSLALNNVLNGVIRTRALARTRLIEHYYRADIVLVEHLALLGKISLLDERLFYRRMDRTTATKLMSAEAVRRHHYPTQTGRALFPSWRFATGSLQAVFSSGLSPTDTVRALKWAARQIYWSFPALGKDVVDAIGQTVRR